MQGGKPFAFALDVEDEVCAFVVDGPPRERAAVPLELRELVELSCDVRRGAEDEPEAGGSLDDPAGSVRADPSPALAPRSAIAVGECAGNGHAAKRATSSPLEVKVESPAWSS